MLTASGRPETSCEGVFAAGDVAGLVSDGIVDRADQATADGGTVDLHFSSDGRRDDLIQSVTVEIGRFDRGRSRCKRPFVLDRRAVIRFRGQDLRDRKIDQAVSVETATGLVWPGGPANTHQLSVTL